MEKKLFKEFEFYYSLIFLVPLIFNPFGYTPYEIPKVAYLMIFVSLGVVLILLLKNKIYINKFVLFAVFLWFASVLISTLLSSAPLESFWGSYQKMQGLLSTIYYLLHFFICYQLAKDKAFGRNFLWITIILGLLVSIYAILQYFHLDPFPLGNIDTFSGRPYSTIGQPNMLGQWLIFPFFVNLFLLIEKKQKLLLGSFIVICCALALTMNKATFIGIFIALGLLFWQSYAKRRISRKVKLIGLVVIFCFVIIFSGTLMKNGARSIASRATLWEESLPIVGLNMVFGIGPEMYYQEIQKHLSSKIYETENLYSMPGSVHFEAYQILINQGLVGMLLYLSLFGFLIYIYFKKDLKGFYVKIAFYSVVTSFIAVQFSFSFSAQIIYLGFLLAVLAREFLEAKTFNFHKLKLYITLPLVVIAVSFFVWTVAYGGQIIMADYYYGKTSEVYVVDKVEAWEFAKKTISMNPNSTFYYSSLIGLFANQDEAILGSYLKNYKDLSGGSFQYYIAQAQFNSEHIGYDQANKSFENAIQLAPSFTLCWQKWGDFLFENGKIEESIEKYEKVIELAPDYIWEQGEKTRIFKKSNILFYFMANQLYYIYLDLGEIEKAENISILIK